MARTTADIPQADVLWDVAQVAEAVLRGHTTADAIGLAIGAKGQRQGQYYAQAARTIGLVDIHEQHGTIQLTNFGLAFARYNRADQRTALRMGSSAAIMSGSSTSSCSSASGPGA